VSNRNVVATVTCATCGATGPGRAGLCRRCYARAQHTPRVCADCNQLRRHLAAGRCARCYRLSRTRQQRCSVCDEVRPVYFGDRCERCKQRARLHLGRCQRCGQQAILSGRYCRACLERAAERVGSCAECLCWTGLLGGRCRPCRLFGWHHDLGDCPSCGRRVPLGAAGRCRLCLATSRAAGTIPNPQTGIQLFGLVGTPAAIRPSQDHAEGEPPSHPAPGAGIGQLRLPRALKVERPSRPTQPTRPTQRCRPAPRTGGQGGGQLRPSRVAAKTANTPRARLDPRQQAVLAALADYGQACGWSPHTLQNVRRALAALLTSCGILNLDAPLAGPLDAAAIRQFLIERHLTARRVVEFLADRGLATVNDQAALDGWLVRRLEALPAQIRVEAQIWVEALRGRGPRAGRPRKATTIQGYLRALEPALGAWSARYQSLRQVTDEDVTDQLKPFTGPTRLLVLAAMRSLFKALKAQRMIFTNPTAGLVGQHAAPAPALGLDPTRRGRLLGNLHRPGERLIVLLAGVHALRCAQICALTVDGVDLAGGTLLVDGQPRRLDALTLAELRAWLAWRQTRWPGTANPHLLVNQSTAGGLTPVRRSSVQAVFQRLGTTAHDLRVDRFMAEVHATGGDPLKLAQLFGISDPTAIRYCLELGPLNSD
jgi:hypothetical protein